jgi:hypothetical protein
VLQRRAREKQIEARVREVHSGRIHRDELHRQSPEGALDAFAHADLLQDATRQTPNPLAVVVLLLERKLQIDADDALDGLQPEQQAIDSRAAAHLEHARTVEGASPAAELVEAAPEAA